MFHETSLIPSPEKEEEEEGPGFSHLHMHLVFLNWTMCWSITECQLSFQSHMVDCLMSLATISK